MGRLFRGTVTRMIVALFLLGILSTVGALSGGVRAPGDSSVVDTLAGNARAQNEAELAAMLAARDQTGETADQAERGTRDAAARRSTSPTKPIVYGTDFPEVVGAEAVGAQGQFWTLSVSLSSAYDSPERFGDAWRVLDANDEQLGMREFSQPNLEQPSVSSKTVRIPLDATTVWIEGRDQANGWSGQRFEVVLPGR